MDPATKDKFKWKFYRLQLLINIVVILIAVAVISLFLAPVNLRIPVAAMLILAAIVLGFFTWKRYKETKAWLEEQSRTTDSIPTDIK